MKKKDKVEIVNKLGSLFNNYYELSSFCDFLDNDIDKIILTISKVIKYVFVSRSFIRRDVTLLALAKEVEIVNVDKKYNAYLDSNNSFFSRLKKDKDINFNIPIDSDIRVNDISSLVLPTISELEKICEDNKKKRIVSEEKVSKEKRLFNQQKGFDEVGLNYSRKDFVTLDSSFIYYGDGLTGEIDRDYDEIYSNFNVPSSNYKDNVKSIQESKDITLKKLGNVYEIENGKKRILYLLKNGANEVIYANITRRIEDKEFNDILIKLKSNYNATIYKNNVLDDNPNVLVVIDNKAYVINSKEELVVFYKNIMAGIPLKDIISFPFKVADVSSNKDVLNEYVKLLFNKYLEKGSKVLFGSFSDVIQYFAFEANSVFYEAFTQIQKDYRESHIFQTDFDKEYKTIIAFDNISDNQRKESIPKL